MTTFTENRPTSPAAPSTSTAPSVLGHKGLQFEEALLFEQSSPGACGVDLPALPAHTPRLGSVKPRGSIGLAELAEPQIVRHYTRLSQKNYAIDGGLYPLGSCTMKHNPRLNEKLARLPGLGDLHPLQPVSTVQGALQLMDELANWLMQLTGMPAVAMSPAAGAHGEFCGMLAIKAAIKQRGEDQTRTKVLVPESAHGTNPATAAALGFSVVPVKAGADGRVTAAAVRDALSQTGAAQVAAIMLTNPNTCGLFEREIIEIAAAVHEAGAYFYCDGANFNAIVGRVRPADLGVDCMHINLHKTFSTPHGGGGPGAGPVVFSDRLAAFVPVPYVIKTAQGYSLCEQASGHEPGRLKGFHGQMGMFIRALAYILSHGADGLHQASGDAVLNANYILARCQDVMSAPYPGPCMHEALFDDSFLKDTGVTTLDFAKAMIDEGFHPMTMYFPLVVHGAMLIEPTESESKQSVDGLIAVLRALAARAKAGDVAHFTGAPRHTPRQRLTKPKPPASRCCAGCGGAAGK